MKDFLEKMQKETGLSEDQCLKVMKHLDKAIHELDDPHAESYGYLGAKVHDLLKSFRDK